MDPNHAGLAPCHTERAVAGTTVVEVRGEIDLLTAMPLSARLDRLTGGRRPDVVLDLRAVNFMDCSGLRVLCRTRNRVRARQGRLRLVTGNGLLLRVLRATRLAEVFEIHPDLPTALFGAVRGAAPRDEVSAAAG